MFNALFSGKLIGLIAGFNTLDQKEQEKYDKKKLGKVVGSGLFLMQTMVILDEHFFRSDIAILIPGIMLAIVIVMFVLANTICRK